MTDETQRERNRERQRRVRANKPTVSFVTDRQTKEDLLSMAQDNGYPSIKAFMEALVKGYREME
ncbi:hypothetical protein R2R70_02475 [Cobetia sp. SIMBA_158]|uniref:hypothetical protein n=1 Tax=Cobetia sp. SIMBA_158 TaxID=3081617 RepID=UPI00398076C2